MTSLAIYNAKNRYPAMLERIIDFPERHLDILRRKMHKYAPAEYATITLTRILTVYGIEQYRFKSPTLHFANKPSGYIAWRNIEATLHHVSRLIAAARPNFEELRFTTETSEVLIDVPFCNVCFALCPYGVATL